ncbi:MAG: GHMP family kinase ATP-binding protein [Promethearchaeota archaeon]
MELTIGMVLIRSKAPCRLEFSGGGTDVSPYSDQYGGLILNASINQYAYCTLTPRDDDEIRIKSLDYGIIAKFKDDKDLEFDGNLDLVKAVVRVMRKYDKYIKKGMNIILHSDVPAGSGLGSSSTVCVALIGAIAEYYRIPLTGYEIADLAYHIEREELGIKGGLQDQYAAVFGGFNLMEFGKNLEVKVNPLKIKQRILNELYYHLVLIYTGKARFGDKILDKQIKIVEKQDEEVLGHYKELKKMALRMKDALIKEKVDNFGELLEEAWMNKKKVAPTISNERIEEIYKTAKENGAIGGRIMGAGGGGHMLFWVDIENRTQMISALEKIGCKYVPFMFDDNGLQVWWI